MSGTLSAILSATRRRVTALASERARLEGEAQRAPTPPSWAAALATDRVELIAEVKRRSPSAGAIAPDLDPARLARSYAAGGAAAISVLTDEEHFGGSLQDLSAVRTAVPLPLLRKDFIIDPVQVYETRSRGASAVLLIVRVLEASQLVDLATLAAELGLARVVEIHDARELDAALVVQPEAIGVNSRDLETFAVNVEGIRELVGRVPRGMVAVAESGLSQRSDVERVAAWGADAVLVGTALARSSDPAAAVRALVGVARVGREP